MNKYLKKLATEMAVKAADALFELGDDLGYPCKRIEFKGPKNAQGVERPQGGLCRSALIRTITKSLESSLTS